MNVSARMRFGLGNGVDVITAPSKAVGDTKRTSPLKQNSHNVPDFTQICWVWLFSYSNASLQISSERTVVTFLDQRLSLDWVHEPYFLHSPSSGYFGGVSSTWMPPRFFSSLSGNGKCQPPSLSGVESHNRIRWRLGVGGA